MKRCATCRRLTILSTLRSGDEIYCSRYCMTYGPMPGFCGACASETRDEPPGNTHLSHVGGSLLLGAKRRCARCHSIVQRKIYFALFLPIWFGRRYRVIYTDRTHYVGRRLVGGTATPTTPV